MSRGIGKTPFGRALASVRMLRGATGEGLSVGCGMHSSTVTTLESGRRHIDGATVRLIARVLGATTDDRRRLAEGMAQSAVDGLDVRYDLVPVGSHGHSAAAVISVFCADLSPNAWSQIERLVIADVSVVADRMGDAA